MPRLRRAPRPAEHRDVGETLVEVVMTVVIIGIAVTALISGLASTAAASTSTRVTADADTVMRNYAESIKDAATTCVDGAPLAIPYVAPAHFTATVSPADPACPPAVDTLKLTLDVTGPANVHQVMQIVVRTP